VLRNNAINIDYDIDYSYIVKKRFTVLRVHNTAKHNEW
jgi:hypothetical protein